MQHTKDTKIDQYISKLSKNVAEKMTILRDTVISISPQTIEKISYGMPAFKLNNNILIYFAAFKNHIGLYPGPSTIEFFKEDLKGYKTSKGTIQFPLDKKLEINLIKKIIKFKITQIN